MIYKFSSFNFQNIKKFRFILKRWLVSSGVLVFLETWKKRKRKRKNSFKGKEKLR